MKHNDSNYTDRDQIETKRGKIDEMERNNKPEKD